MKKMNSTSKRKWILGGTLGFGAVALLTTGFATWIIGVNKTQTNGDTIVTVDTTKNESAVLEVELSDANITLAETTKVEGAYISSEGTPNALDITFSSIKFTYGSGFLAEGESISAIEFSLPTTAQEGLDTTFTDNTVISTSENASQLRKTSGPWTYIEAPAKITEGLTPNEESKNQPLKVIEIKNKTVSFQRGTYFQNKSQSNVSPANYYNEALNYKGNATIADLDNVDTELKAMHTALDNKTIHLLAKVVKTGGAAA